ncbi:MAG: hypothetical protein RCO49_07025 [Rickettsia endosymbiont of Argas persicus]
MDIIQKAGVTEKEATQKLLSVIGKLPPEEMQEKGSKIVKDFAPLLE